MGGPSAEHEVSLNSGSEVLKYIDKDRNNVRAVVITRKKEFFFTDIIGAAIPSPDDLHRPHAASCMKGPYAASNAAGIWENCDAAFLALHGSFGEDGIIQGYLESIGIPYTGSDVYGSAVAMNKITSKYLYIRNGITVPPYAVFGKRFPQNTIEHMAATIGFPCFIKCPQSGSSRLMGRAATLRELSALINEYTPYASEILIEQMVSGPEFTCGVLDDDDGNPFALPPIEIRPKDTFFSYDAKYTDGGSEEIVPAPRPQKLLEAIQRVALDAHTILGCSGISRTDMILANDELHVLETNTLPGLTANSLIPKSYKAIGGTFTELIDLLIRQALRRKPPETV